MLTKDVVKRSVELIRAGNVPFVTGKPGIGKSALAVPIADAVKCKLASIILPLLEPVDVMGVPAVEPGAKLARFVPYGLFAEYVYGAASPTLVLLDDVGQSSQAVQKAIMQLVHGRKLNGHTVSEHVRFILASNRSGDKAGVERLISPLRSRVVELPMEADLDTWVQWALGAGIDTRIIAFLRFRPQALLSFDPAAGDADRPYACPRSWEFLSRSLTSGSDLTTADGVEFASGHVGEAYGAEFVGFLRVFAKLPNPDLVLQSPDTAEVPTDAATLCALCGAIARRANDNNGERVFRYAGRVPADVSVWFVADVLKVCPALVNSRGYIAWATKFGSKVS